jgi:hypothetical protein
MHKHCIDKYSAYFKFNLNTINLFGLIRLDDNPENLAYYKAAYDFEWRILAGQSNAHFNMIDPALKIPDPGRDDQTGVFLREWLTRPRRDYYVDLSGTYATCGPNRSCELIPVPLRIASDFIWQRIPYQLSGGGAGMIETAGIDYILPCWMARFYNLPVE